MNQLVSVDHDTVRFYHFQTNACAELAHLNVLAVFLLASNWCHIFLHIQSNVSCSYTSCAILFHYSMCGFVLYLHDVTTAHLFVQNSVNYLLYIR